MRELKADGLLPAETKLRSFKYLNNLIEQDHRGVKQRIATMLGFFVIRNFRQRRLPRTTCSSPRREACDVFGLKSDGVGR